MFETWALKVERSLLTCGEQMRGERGGGSGETLVTLWHWCDSDDISIFNLPFRGTANNDKFIISPLIISHFAGWDIRLPSTWPAGDQKREREEVRGITWVQPLRSSFRQPIGFQMERYQIHVRNPQNMQDLVQRDVVTSSINQSGFRKATTKDWSNFLKR